MSRLVAPDYANKRDGILRAAARLFADEGYGRASMAEVARVCGISKANIYHYYSSKDVLLFDILETHLLYLRDRLLNMTFPGDDPKENLHFLTAEILLAYQGADAEHDVLLNEIKALPEEQQEVLRQYQREFISVGRRVLEQMVPPDIVSDRPKMRALTMSFFGMLNWHYKWCRDADDQTRRSHAKMIAELTIGGVGSLS